MSTSQPVTSNPKQNPYRKPKTTKTQEQSNLPPCNLNKQKQTHKSAPPKIQETTNTKGNHQTKVNNTSQHSQPYQHQNPKVNRQSYKATHNKQSTRKNPNKSLNNLHHKLQNETQTQMQRPQQRIPNHNDTHKTGKPQTNAPQYSLPPYLRAKPK